MNVYASTVPGTRRLERMLAALWSDPLFGGGANRGWLLATFAVTLASAFLAWRFARLRAPHRKGWWLCAVLLLGPTGLVWMWIVTPRCAIEDGRAVNLDSPAWPEPARKGTEVFA
jgi:hypothetical protein